MGRRRRRVRRGRARGHRRDVERRSADRRRRHVRDDDAEREARRGSDARAVGPRAVGARARHHARRARARRGHVREPVRRAVSGIRSRARRVRVHPHAAAARDEGARHLRRQGPERALRRARARRGADSRRRGARSAAGQHAGERPGARLRDRARHGHRAQARRVSRSARPHRAAAVADRQLGPTECAGRFKSAVSRRHGTVGVFRVRKNGGSDSRRDDARRHDIRGRRARISDPPGALRSQRSGVPRDARAESARDRRGARARRRARRRTGARPVSRRPDRVQGQHRRAGAADHRRIARARRSSAAPRLAHGGRHAPRRRGDARQSEPRRVPVRRFRHQLRRRHHRQRVRSDAEHLGLERRERGRDVD